MPLVRAPRQTGLRRGNITMRPYSLLRRRAFRGMTVDTAQPGKAGSAQSPRAQKAIRAMKAGAWR